MRARASGAIYSFWSGETPKAAYQASMLRGDVAAAHEALAAAQREAEELLTGGGAMRARLDEATGRLRQMQGVMAELSAEAGLL